MIPFFVMPTDILVTSLTCLASYGYQLPKKMFELFHLIFNFLIQFMCEAMQMI